MSVYVIERRVGEGWVPVKAVSGPFLYASETEGDLESLMAVQARACPDDEYRMTECLPRDQADKPAGVMLTNMEQRAYFRREARLNEVHTVPLDVHRITLRIDEQTVTWLAVVGKRRELLLEELRGLGAELG